MIRVMRLWRDGKATPIWTGTSLTNATIWLTSVDKGKCWIEDDRHPAVDLGSDWRPLANRTSGTTKNHPSESRNHD